VGFAFAGAAISLHILVGGYAFFCIVVAALLNKTWRSEWRRLIYQSWPLFITGVFGLQAVIQQILPQSNVDATRAWEIYVQFRNPHHVLPSAWGGYAWMALLVLATGLFLIMYFNGKANTSCFVAAYALGSVFLFLIGLVLFAVGQTPLLRFYWFRFPDVMVPLMSAVIIALFLGDVSEGGPVEHTLLRGFLPALQAILWRVFPIIFIAVTIVNSFQSLHRLQAEFRDSRQPNSDPMLSTLEWISENTPQQAIFLVDPSLSDFYLHAQRAMFVSWKHTPHSAAEILEWYERITLCNGNRVPEKRGYDSLEELRTDFYTLDEDQISQIARLYGISYYLGLTDQQLGFERVYSNSSFAVYRVNDIGEVRTGGR
jgi:hypothetical protein